MKQTCPASPLEPITSIENVIRALEATKKDLLQQGIHPSVNSLVGVPTDQLQLIDIVLARMEGRQKNLLQSDLGELAFEERIEYDKLIDAMKPIVNQIVEGDPSAEEVVKQMSETGQPDHARRILAGNVSGSQAVVELHAQLKSDEDLKINKRSFKADQTYTLGMIAQSSDIGSMNGTATIVETSGEWKLFSDPDRATAQIKLKFPDSNRLKIFSLCQTFGIKFKAKVSPSIKLAATGVVFSGTLIDFLDMPKLSEDIQRCQKAFVNDLFDPLK